MSFICQSPSVHWASIVECYEIIDGHLQSCARKKKRKRSANSSSMKLSVSGSPCSYRGPCRVVQPYVEVVQVDNPCSTLPLFVCCVHVLFSFSRPYPPHLGNVLKVPRKRNTCLHVRQGNISIALVNDCAFGHERNCVVKAGFFF